MGHPRIINFLVVIACFCITAVFIYQKDANSPVIKKISIDSIAENIKGWKKFGKINLDGRIVSSLELDDYLYDGFIKNGIRLDLYIGYYYSSKKLSAAHSPLVCYPGQGWNILTTKKSREKVEGHDLNFMTMEIANGGRKELILYWFQINDKTTYGTFEQKINSLLYKIRGQGEDNAFVRVSVPMDNLDKKEAYQMGVEFIHAFYPNFLNFINESS